MEYRVVIGAELNGRLCYFDLDTCTERSLNSTATVPQYPVEDGVTVADHMYRNARTLNLTGSFSLAGRNSYENNNLYTKDNIIGNLGTGTKSWDKWFEEDAEELKDLNGANRLEAIQKVFEYIQAKGILCTIMMCGRTNTENTRFKVRNNMALTSISWREQYNSMSYSFGFTEVITVTTVGQFQTFDYDGLYPMTELPATKSLGDVVNESGTVYKTVIEALLNWNYISLADGRAYVLKGARDSAFYSVFEEVIPVALGLVIAGAGGVAAGLLAGGIAAKVAATGGAAAGPVGLVIGLAVAGVILGVCSAINLYKKNKVEKRLAAGFNLIQNYSAYVDPKTFEPTGVSLSNAVINQTDIARLRVLMEDIQYEIDKELRNVQFYVMPDSPGDLAVQVGVDTLTLRVSATENDEQPFSMQILRGFGETAEPVTPLFGSWCAVASLQDLDENRNAMYKDTSRQYWMFLLNPYLDSEVAKASGFATSADAGKILSNYYVVTVRGSIKDAMDKLSKVIVKTLGNQGYTE